MTIFSLLYASRSTIPANEAEAAVEALVDVSRSRNETLGLTGCLIFGGGRFAQVLEGDQAVVQDIVDRISRDDRHTDFAVLEQGTIPARRFMGWALGYAGPSLFVRRRITAPIAEASRGSDRGISELLDIMKSFRSGQLAKPGS